MPSLQIRNLPDDLYQTLTFRAEQAHRSLAQEALETLRNALENTGAARREQILEQIGQDIAAAGARKLSFSPAQLLREDRDR